MNSPNSQPDPVSFFVLSIVYLALMIYLWSPAIKSIWTFITDYIKDEWDGLWGHFCKISPCATFDKLDLFDLITEIFLGFIISGVVFVSLLFMSYIHFNNLIIFIVILASPLAFYALLRVARFLYRMRRVVGKISEVAHTHKSGDFEKVSVKEPRF